MAASIQNQNLLAKACKIFENPCSTIVSIAYRQEIVVRLVVSNTGNATLHSQILQLNFSFRLPPLSLAFTACPEM
ncbi:hypothetical protein KIN20_001465 [Parelaphostrongylus tenuis]|uniref:Uncharacterized protein n=1 Tax=Parelaphostrongylus tenuis TaxID=148309 RepID=A0AAD5MEZ8_PARTN|nr:hypothetical protein KIN20_001465 [Parelaphostrongylus tenuis]